MHRALEAVFERLYSAVPGARFERRSDLVVAIFPSVPIPQANGVWVSEESDVAVDALADAVAEVDAAGEWPWVQTRSGHERAREAALALGLTHTARIPGMAVRPDAFVGARADLEIGLITAEEIDETNGLLAASFEAPIELFRRFASAVEQVEEARWYVGRARGAVVSTALGFTVEGATGIFNVATPSEHRGCGYGAALTSHALREGFEAGSELGYLQSSTIGHAIYQRLGFRDVEEYTLLTRPPQG